MAYKVVNYKKEVEMGLNSNVPSTKIFLMRYFCTYFAQNNFFGSVKKPMKYNIVRIIILCSKPHRIFIILGNFELIKFLPSAFQKWGLYLDKLAHCSVP